LVSSLNPRVVRKNSQSLFGEDMVKRRHTKVFVFFFLAWRRFVGVPNNRIGKHNDCRTNLSGKANVRPVPLNADGR